MAERDHRQARPPGEGRERLAQLLSRRPAGASPSFDGYASGAPSWPSGWTLARDTYHRTRGFLFIFTLVVGGSASLAFAPQGEDLITVVAENGRGQAIWLAVALLWLGLQAWFWMRRIVDANYPERGGWGPASPFLLWAPRLTGWAPLLLVFATAIVDRERGWVDADMDAPAPWAEALMGLFCLGYITFTLVRTHWGPLARLSALGPWWLWPIVSAGVSLVLLVVFTVEPVGLAQTLGPAAVVFLALASILPVMSAVIQLGDAKNAPVTPLLLVAAAVFSVVTDRQHTVGGRLLGRTPPALPADAVRPDLDGALAAWTQAQQGPPRILAVVAAEGGASRAGVWTAVALQRLNTLTQGAFARRTFAISSVSGGSVGAVGWAASLDAAGCPAATEPALTHDGAPLPSTCLERFVNADALSPTLAAMLYPDLIQRTLPLPILPDRARALELAWERGFDHAFAAAHGAPRLSQPYRRLWTASLGGSGPWIPFVVVGGSSEETGRRILTSPVRLAPGYAPGEVLGDIYDLYGRDLAASTAILDGARFPWISPAGRLERGGQAEHIVDGGYFDGSGLQTARDLLRWVAQRRPGLPLLLVVIRYRDAAVEAKPSSAFAFGDDLLAPAIAGLASRSALQAHFEDAPAAAPAPQEIDVELSGERCEGLPLDWMLSRKARRYVESLGSDDGAQRALSAVARAVLANDATPATPAPVRDRFTCPGASGD